MRTDHAITRPSSKPVSMRPIVDRQITVKTLLSLAFRKNCLESSYVQWSTYQVWVLQLPTKIYNMYYFVCIAPPRSTPVQYFLFPCSFQQNVCQIIVGDTPPPGWHTLPWSTTIFFNFGIGIRGVEKAKCSAYRLVPQMLELLVDFLVGEESHSHVNCSCSAHQRSIFSKF